MKRLYLIFVFLFIFCCFGCSQKQEFSVWWWDDSLDLVTYVDFAKQNNINSIYYCNSTFDDKTADFISYANYNDIQVYWLAGEYQWLNNNAKLIEKIESYVNYQNNYPKYKFKGIHLDIEPHQNPDFEQARYGLIYNLIDLAYNLKSMYPKIEFYYDLPFWLDDEILYNSTLKPAYAHMIDISNGITLMSYRDTAQDIYNVSSDEIEYAKSVNKQLVLGVETKSTEGDNVSFMEEGKQIMNQELELLRTMIPKNFGIAVHHIKSWYDLKD